MTSIIPPNGNGGIVPPWLQHPPIPIARTVPPALSPTGMAVAHGVTHRSKLNQPVSVRIGQTQPTVKHGTRIGVNVLNVLGSEES